MLTRRSALQLISLFPCLTHLGSTSVAKGKDEVGMVSQRRPHALIIAFSKYPNNPLSFPIVSAIKLARSLHKCGFSVQLNSDNASFDADSNRALLSELDAEIGIEVVESVESLETRVETWLSTCFSWATTKEPVNVPFGLLFFVGHGSISSEGQLLHFPGPTSNKKALNVTELQQRIGTVPLPVALFVDTCRSVNKRVTSSVTTSDITSASIGDGPEIPDEFRSKTRGDVLDPESDLGTLTIQSAPIDTKAIDSEKDMLSCLAKALELVDQPLSFIGRQKAKLYDMQLPAFEHITELSLETWILFARHLMGSSQQPIQAIPGIIDTSMLVSSRDASSNILANAPFDLLQEFDDRPAIVSGIDVERKEHGIEFHRTQADLPIQFNGFNVRPHHRLAGKSILVEVVARKTREFADTRDTVRCLFQPSQSKGSKFLSTWCRTPQTIPVNEPKTFLIPLNLANHDSELDVFALSTPAPKSERDDWPVDTTITITKLILMDTGSDEVLEELIEHPELSARTFNLLTRWWSFQYSPARRDQVVVAKMTAFKEKGAFLLTLQTDRVDPGQQVGVSGPIYPGFRVSPELFVLEIVVHSFECRAQKCSIRIMITDGEKSIAILSREITKDDLRKTLSEQLLTTGVPSSMTLVTNAEVLNIEGLRIVPKDNSASEA